MEREEGGESRQKGSVLSQAGQMTLHPSQQPSHTNIKRRILQQVDNDDEFIKLDNITTTYLPVNTPTEPVRKPKQQSEQSEYEEVASRIEQSSTMVLNSLIKKNQRVRASYRSEDDLTGIEEIIGDIQRVMEASLASPNPNPKSSFKKQTSLKHPAKRNFHSKQTSNFHHNTQAVNRLEELLLHYHMDDPQLDQPINITLKDASSLRRTKNEERLARTKQYNSISQSISTEPVTKPTRPLPSLPTPPKQKLIGLANIQVVEIDWFKLPLFLAPLPSSLGRLLLEMKDYPDDECYWTAISESLREEREYKAYSIFNCDCEAGVGKEGSLLSEEQFRERWAEEWSYEIEEEEHKDLLCEFDFQWYRSLVQASCGHSLEDILMKDIKCDIAAYRKNLKAISQEQANDKNRSPLPLTELSTLNKLSYVEWLLDEYSKGKAKKSGSRELFVGVVPNIGQSQSKEAFQSLKEHLKGLFVGGLFSSESAGSSMGVVITKRQAEECKVRKWEGGKVELGSVDLLINEGGGGGRDEIHLSRVKSKNSAIRLRVVRPGEEGVELQVGEQLYFGRRYHILLD